MDIKCCIIDKSVITAYSLGAFFALWPLHPRPDAGALWTVFAYLFGRGDEASGKTLSRGIKPRGKYELSSVQKMISGPCPLLVHTINKKGGGQGDGGMWTWSIW